MNFGTEIFFILISLIVHISCGINVVRNTPISIAMKTGMKSRPMPISPIMTRTPQTAIIKNRM